MVLASVVLVLAGCEATIRSESQVPYTPGQGVWADVDGLRVRGVVAVAPSNGSATLVGTILNEGRQGDALVAIRLPDGRAELGRSPLSIPPGRARVLGVDTSLGRATPATLRGPGIRLGEVVPVTFVFDRAGRVSLDVLVVAREGPFATVGPPGGAAAP
ncbi:MAG TPA: hypothetical protein VIL34_05745 [Actinopolymorphaceae bacterium]|jgi:hypothetical protein